MIHSSVKENSNDTGDTNKIDCLWNVSENWHGLVGSTIEQETPI